jgi:protein phosphatase
MEYVVYTNKGKVRPENEDSYLIKETPYPLFAVADGMGGHQAGEVASQLAVKFLESAEFDYQDILESIRLTIEGANREIYNKGMLDSSYTGMGTTLSMGIIYENRLYIGHVGDSRIYLIRDNELIQLTTDHSLVNELIVNKQITRQEAFNHPQKNIITQALGTSDELKVEIKEIGLFSGDILLFSTDGLHDMLCSDEINDIFAKYKDKDLEQVSSILGDEALKKGGKDNITFIIIRINSHQGQR